MEFDAKQKVLVAIYIEYQKDVPDMDSINAATVGVDKEVFKIAVNKLQSEGLIRGASINTGGGKIGIVYLSSVMMTPYGLNYVETKLGIQPEKAGMEKVKELTQKAASWGWNEAKDFTAKVLSEIIQSQAGMK